MVGVFVLAKSFKTKIGFELDCGRLMWKRKTRICFNGCTDTLRHARVENERSVVLSGFNQTNRIPDVRQDASENFHPS